MVTLWTTDTMLKSSWIKISIACVDKFISSLEALFSTVWNLRRHKVSWGRGWITDLMIGWITTLFVEAWLCLGWLIIHNEMFKLQFKFIVASQSTGQYKLYIFFLNIIFFVVIFISYPKILISEKFISYIGMLYVQHRYFMAKSSHLSQISLTCLNLFKISFFLNIWKLFDIFDSLKVLNFWLFKYSWHFDWLKFLFLNFQLFWNIWNCWPF